MLERRLNRLPIMRNENIVGIFTRHDLLKLMLEQIANLTKAVRDLSQIQKYEEAVENSLVRTRKGSKKVVVSQDRAYLID